jgi:hypothetical protein
MTPENDEPYFLQFRWGSFRFSLAGRGPMLLWAAVIGSAVGVKLLWPAWQSALTP